MMQGVNTLNPLELNAWPPRGRRPPTHHEQRLGQTTYRAFDLVDCPECYASWWYAVM